MLFNYYSVHAGVKVFIEEADHLVFSNYQMHRRHTAAPVQRAR